jgi:hypothetical protein
MQFLSAHVFGDTKVTQIFAAVRGSRFGPFPLLDDALTALCVWAWNLKIIFMIEEFVRKPKKKLTSFSLTICMIPTGRRGPSTSIQSETRCWHLAPLDRCVLSATRCWHLAPLDRCVLSATRCWHRRVFYLRRVVGTGISVFGEFSYPQDKMKKASTIRTKVYFGKKIAQYVKSLTL